MSSKSYKILINDIFGRFMVANKNIKQGELILKEAPALLGPQLNGPAKCFKCLKNIDLLMCFFCEQCNTALMCAENCKGKYHNENECATLRAKKIKGQILAENPSLIFPLRCLLMSTYNPELFDEILALESHLEARRNTVVWRRHRVSVEDILKQTSLISKKELDEELVQKICGILDVNSFEVRPPNSAQIMITNPGEQCLRALYPKAAMMSHNCSANTHIAVDDNFIINIYAKLDIKQNEPIFSNYANVLQGTKERQEHLREGKYFICSCSRCEDPSEFGTEISSLICHKCRKGLLRYIELEKGFKIWQCNKCKLCFKDFLINIAVDEGRRRIENLDPSSIQEMEKLYKSLLLTFHPNHYLLLELKQIMVALYSKLPPTKNNLNKKIDLCGRLLSVFSKIEHGISRIKALSLYQLQSAIVDLSNKRYREKEIYEKELIEDLKTGEMLLKDAAKYLLYEPTKSPEGRMAQLVLKELKMLRNSIRNIEKQLLILGNSIKEPSDNSKSQAAKRLREKLEKTT